VVLFGLNEYSTITAIRACVSSGGLAVKYLAPGVKGHRFDPITWSKPFQELISRLTTSWVVNLTRLGIYFVAVFRWKICFIYIEIDISNSDIIWGSTKIYPRLLFG